MNIRKFLYLICKPSTPDWKPEVEAYNNVIQDREKVNFMYENAKERLQSTIDSHDFLEKKILLLLSYLITVNTVIIGYIIKNYDKTVAITKQIMPFYWQISTIFCIFTFIILCLILISKPKDFYLKGNDVENLFEHRFCSIDINSIIIGEIISHKDRIDFNQDLINIERFIFNTLLFITIISPILFLI